MPSSPASSPLLAPAPVSGASPLMHPSAGGAPHSDAAAPLRKGKGIRPFATAAQAAQAAQAAAQAAAATLRPPPLELPPAVVSVSSMPLQALHAAAEHAPAHGSGGGDGGFLSVAAPEAADAQRARPLSAAPASASRSARRVPSDIAIYVHDADPAASTRSLPVGGGRPSTTRRPPLMSLFAPRESAASDSDTDASATSSSSLPRRSRSQRANQGKRRHSFLNQSSNATLGVSPLVTEPRQSASSLSLANLAASLQDYHRKRHGPKDLRSYSDVFGDREEYELKRDFMLDLARAMAEYGVPVHRLEYHLEAVGESLGVSSSFVVIAGLVLMSFSRKKRHSETFFIKANGGYNMGKLSLVNDLCFELVHGGMPVQTAQDRLVQIRNANDWPFWSALLTYPIMSFVLCVIGFNGTWMDALIAATASIPVALVTYTGALVPSVTYLVEFLSALLAVIVVNLLRVAAQGSFPCLSTSKMVFSAIAILLPGLSLTTAIIEISTRNLVSGTVRLFYALFLAMLLGFGYSIGDRLTASLPLAAADASCPSAPISQLWAFLLFPPLSFGICFQFFALRKQYPIMIVTQVVGFVITTVLGNTPGFRNNTEAITIIAAFAIGLIANIYARITRDVAIAPIIGGILLLVPGSVGLRSTLGFFAQDALGGTAVAFQMLLIGLSITVGLFLATLLVWPLHGPRMKYMTV
ncbi:pheromone-regulated protein prm10 [Polyrhizophydium stewartii]|uniref:Pheromone-regulated protein prm10 n=1 Tax=Polyrhizophydium stewartii TaxID=2732419 RepID=A0ABR4N1U7_9FUNG